MQRACSLLRLKWAMAALCLLGLSQVAYGYAYNYGLPEQYSVGFYMGGQGGYANLHYDRSDLLPTATSGSIQNDKGAAGRLYWGIDFNQYFGLETGVSYFRELKVNNVNATGVNLNVQQYAFDLLAKGSMPLMSKFSGVVKGGAAYVWSNRDFDATTAMMKPADQRKVVPTVAIGLRYTPVPYFAFDVSWQRFFGRGSLEDTDLFTAGIILEYWCKHSSESSGLSL